MQTQPQANAVTPRTIRRADVAGVVHVDAIDRAAADRFMEPIRTLARASAHGEIEVAEAYDERAARLTLTVTGSLSPVLRLLSGKSPGGGRLIDDRGGTSFTASIDNVGAEKAVAISDHLMSAAKNHPSGDPPLDVRTEHVERERRLRVRISGSLFATSYLLFLVNLHLTQSST
jgi:hypothetical protein